MATAEQAKESARRRKANQRARDKGLPEPYPVASVAMEEEEKSQREAKHMQDLAWAQEQDATGRFYKSECRLAVQLLAVYEGNNNVGVEDSGVEIDPKTGKKKQNIPNPSISAVRIRATETEVEGQKIKIDPDMLEYKSIFEVNHVLSFKEWLDLRDKGRRDLFWLSHVMGKSLFHNSHQMICDKFVQKDFSGLYFPEFERSDLAVMINRQKRVANDGETPTKWLLLFAPRGGWKSTIDGIDAVQWMLNAPDCRVMIVTAFRKLAKLFLGEIKRYFYLAPLGKASNFQLLYPEYVLTGVDGRSAEPIRCPAATMESKEPHLWITSMESSATGMRCDICKADDIVDPKNSNSDELRQSLAFEFSGLTDLVEPWGFIDIIGTRYYTDDYYGTRMSPDEDGNVAPFSFLCISAWYPKPQFVERYNLLLEDPNGMQKVTPDMVDLWFPFKLNFQILRDKLLSKKERNSNNIQKERSFRNQQLNVATDPMEASEFVVHFDRETLRQHTYAAAAAPTSGEELVTVDWSYTENRASDYTVFAAIRRHTRVDGTEELIVREIEYDKLKSSDIASRLVLFLRKHRPNRTFIEKSNGWDLLWFSIRAYATKWDCIDVLTSIHWVETGNTLRAKANRVKTLEILLADDRLHFVSGPWLDEVYKQFERFTGETKMGRKDDIPDAISQASRTLPATMFTTVKTDPEEDRAAKELHDKAVRKARHYEQYFGSRFSGTRTNPGPPNEQAPTWRERLYGRKPTTPEPEPEPEKPMDPRMRIFGNKGPWRL